MSSAICVACQFDYIGEGSAIVKAETVGDGSADYPYKVRTRRETGDIIGIEMQSSESHSEMMLHLSTSLTSYLSSHNMDLNDVTGCGDTEEDMFSSIIPTIAVI